MEDHLDHFQDIANQGSNFNNIFPGKNVLIHKGSMIILKWLEPWMSFWSICKQENYDQRFFFTKK